METKKKDTGWDGKPQWRVVEAGPHNHNPLIEDILIPLRDGLRQVLKLELKELDKRIRRK